MNANEQEIEVKFYLNNLAGLEQKLNVSGAKLDQARVFELNLRFDTQEGELNRAGKVLRLRQDVQTVLTFKGPGQINQDVNHRQEIEFNASDFNAARHFLEALGYTVAITYEKYRTTYTLGEAEVVLDEMPFGNFAEIEGPDPTLIREIAIQLGLDWDARCIDSYLGLFRRLQDARKLSFRDLTFFNFSGVKISAADLGLKAAD
jgi:adenylate cyclase, class 2